MSDKKHIDRLFQEHFKDFEVAPSDAVWKNIEAKLGEKKKKRIIPIWWKYAGSAAVIALLLTVGIQLFSTEPIERETPENVNTNININTPSSESIKVASDHTTKDEANNENAELNNNSNGIKSTQNTLNSKQKTSTPVQIASSTETTGKMDPHDVESQISKNNNNNTLLANTSESNKTKLSDDTEKNELNIKEEYTKNQNIAENKPEKPQEKGTNLTIEDAIKSSNSIAEEKEKLNRWSITPNVAPVYFNSLGEGSSLDQQFTNNAKTGEINMSYGINASYALNKKLRIRSGVNRVNLGYNTNNVVVYESTAFSSSSSTLENVSPSGGFVSNSSNDGIAVISSENLSEAGKTPETFKSFNTSLNQSFGFIEVPLEIEYTITDKKFGLNVIGGFSSLFLNNNDVYSEPVNGSRTYIGEATNIKDVSYSANFGLGLNYKVTRKIDFNLEPMFKYQINTFSNTSGDFKPYFIGIYSGFAIKF
ncbi:hypothetical protein [Aestuariibaculum sediminum]|uniref:Outer membrane protein beta-barrel domain-containing protein n=1 Tax=Aestuariibaculum sediminum TaxID=2770637 RepID=A0A8J6U741_9FLAO|nr:hypothetical protein [Aestuariibaculum sediminum]MBD0831345.1 hypothetical protein [Aestuariibaculum sediminum]